MSDLTIQLAHDELSLLLFALEGGKAAPPPDASSCEEACPVVESVEQLLCGGEMPPEQQLIRHLNNHIREGLIECGVFELMAGPVTSGGVPLRALGDARLVEAYRRLKEWKCEVRLKADEAQALLRALKRLPRSAWISMPRTLWKLRKKLRAR